MTEHCVCGFKTPRHMEPWTAEWHRLHKEHHLDAFPHLVNDVVTVGNLDQMIRVAEAKQ